MITEKIDSITKISPEYMKAVLPAPKSVKIEISPRCNYRCGFCALRTRENQPKHDMDFDLFKKITQEMRDAGVEEIGVFYLGESFMNPRHLVDCIKWCKDIGFPYVFLTSNASLSEPFWVGECMAAGLDSLKWSVNVADEDQFVNVIGVSPKYFDIALENIRLAWNVRQLNHYKTKLYASSIRYDGEQQKKMEKLLAERVRPFVDQHYFLPLYQMGMFSEEVEKRIGYKPSHGNAGRIDENTGFPNREPIPCWAAFMEGHVRADGHLSVCCFGSDERFDAGDLNTQPFMEAWNSEKFQEIRRAHIRAATNGTSELCGTMCESCVAFGGSNEKVGDREI